MEVAITSAASSWRFLLMLRFAATPRLPRSGNAALAAGAFIQAALGIEFVLAGLSKAVDPEFSIQFQSFIKGSPGATSGPLAGLIQWLVVPNAELFAQLAELSHRAQW